MAGGKKDGKLVNPNSCCLSTAAIAGDRRDQKLAAIITPPVKPRAASRSFLLADLKKNTRLAPSSTLNKTRTRQDETGHEAEEVRLHRHGREHVRPPDVVAQLLGADDAGDKEDDESNQRDDVEEHDDDAEHAHAAAGTLLTRTAK